MSENHAYAKENYSFIDSFDLLKIYKLLCFLKCVREDKFFDLRKVDTIKNIALERLHVRKFCLPAEDH